MTVGRIPNIEGGIQPTLLTTTGDIMYASSASNPARLGIGSTNQVLGVTAGVPAYQASSKSTLTTTGDILYASAANTPARLGIGTSGQVLQVNSGATAPEWATPASGSMTLLSTTTLSGASTTISSISQSYNTLYAIITGITSTADGRIRCAPNGNTTNSYSVDFDKSGVILQRVDAARIDILGEAPRSVAANANNAVVFQINNYTGSTWKPFSVVGSYFSGSQAGYFNFGAISVLTGITSLVFSNALGNLSTGTVLLYGVK